MQFRISITNINDTRITKTFVFHITILTEVIYMARQHSTLSLSLSVGSQI